MEAMEEGQAEVGSPGSSFNVRVCSQEGQTFCLPASKDACTSQLLQALAVITCLPASRLRLIYKGRVLRSEERLGAVGVEPSHVMHLTVLPEGHQNHHHHHQNQQQSQRSSTATLGGTHSTSPSANGIREGGRNRPERTRWEHHARGESGVSSSGRPTGLEGMSADEAALIRDVLTWQQISDATRRDMREQMMITQDSSLADGAIARERESMEVLIGLAIGFMLGFLATLCLLDGNMSKRLKLGIIIGLGTNMFVAVTRMSALRNDGSQMYD